MAHHYFKTWAQNFSVPFEKIRKPVVEYSYTNREHGQCFSRFADLDFKFRIVFRKKDALIKVNNNFYYFQEASAGCVDLLLKRLRIGNLYRISTTK